jgi:translation initiation factor 1
VSKRDRDPPEPAPAPFHSPFAGLASRLAPLPPGPVSATTGTPRLPKVRPPPARAVVRVERKGRGGKVVTVVEKLGLPERELEGWLGELKRALGCGGAVEGAALLLQGDCRERAGRWLEGRGVAKVTVA